MKQIKDSIEPQEQDVMGSDIFHILIFGDHIKLRQDGESFKPDRKCPKNTINSELGVHDKAKHDGQEIQPVMWKRIGFIIIALG